MSTTLQEVLAARTPRPPKLEWFGFGPGQWDSWWVQTTKASNISRTTLTLREAFIDDAGGVATPKGWHIPILMIESCVPVAREGYPAPVGWQVLEVSK